MGTNLFQTNFGVESGNHFSRFLVSIHGHLFHISRALSVLNSEEFLLSCSNETTIKKHQRLDGLNQMCYLTAREMGSVKSRWQQDQPSHWGPSGRFLALHRKLRHSLAYRLVTPLPHGHMILCLSFVYKETSHIAQSQIVWTHFNYLCLERSWRLGL